MKLRRFLPLITAALLLAGCMPVVPELDESYLPAAAEENADPGATTVQILLFGEISGLPPVLEELHSQMDANGLGLRVQIETVSAKDYVSVLSLKLQAREDLDLVFNAPWMNLNAMVESGMCMDLSGYFGNDAYPGLREAFPPAYLDANRINRRVYAVPITNAYHDPLGVYYRRDLLAEAGLDYDTIHSEEELMGFYERALELWPDLVPLSLGNRGFHIMNMNDMYLRTRGVHDIAGVSVWDYPGKVVLDPAGGKVLDVVFAGDDAARFEAFGMESNFLSDFLLKNAARSKYVQPFSMLSVSRDEMFLHGGSLSMEGELSACSLDLQDQVRRNVPEAEIAFWSYEWIFEEENRKEAAIPATLQAWNFLCVPQYSAKAAQSMKLLDWLFADRGRLELLTYGIPGTDWEPVGDDEYNLLRQSERQYQFPAYEMTWSPIYSRMRSGLPEYERALTQYAFSDASYRKIPLSGWSLNTASISIELAQLTALYQEYAPAFKHGSYGGQTGDKIAELHGKSLELGLETVRQELIRQAQYFLDTSQ